MKRADETTKQVNAYDDLEPGVAYPKSWLTRLTLPRGRFLHEALLNDPQAPEPTRDVNATLFTTEQILAYVASYGVPVNTDATAAAVLDRAEREARRLREAARKDRVLAREERKAAASRMEAEIRDWLTTTARSEVARVLDDLTREIPSPRASGIYFLMQDSAIVYVGQSVNVYSRVATHATEKEFNRVRYMPCDAADLNEWEGFFIRLLDPPLNGKNKSGAHCAPPSKTWDRLAAKELPRDFLLSIGS